MAKLLKLRRGTTTQHGSFTGAEGELTIDTTKDTAVVHDGSQAGGRPLLREDMSNLPAGTIDNADVNASAAIAGTKISPDFGSQDITTTGKVKFANVYSNESDLPSASTYHGMFAHVHSTGLAYYAHGGNWIKLAKLDAPDFTGGIDVTGSVVATGNEHKFTSASGDTKLIIQADSGNNNSNENDTPYLLFRADGTLDEGAIFLDNNTLNIASSVSAAGGINFRTSTTDSGYDSAPTRMSISNTGQVDFEGNVDCNAGLDVTGNITATGTVDGRDVAADGTKLDGIESGATADQTGAEIANLINGQHIYTTGRLGRDSTDFVIFTDNSRLDVHLNGSNEFRFESDGDFHADGDIIAQSTTTSSDIKLKENIKVVPDALDKVESLRGVTFDWKRDGTPSAGVIAQEVQGVLPEAVKEVTPVGGGDSHLTVNYHALTSILIEAIKELKAEVEELKGGA